MSPLLLLGVGLVPRIPRVVREAIGDIGEDVKSLARRTSAKVSSLLVAGRGGYPLLISLGNDVFGPSSLLLV